jgi:hypothetical protein
LGNGCTFCSHELGERLDKEWLLGVMSVAEMARLIGHLPKAVITPAIDSTSIV